MFCARRWRVGGGVGQRADTAVLRRGRLSVFSAESETTVFLLVLVRRVGLDA